MNASGSWFCSGECSACISLLLLRRTKRQATTLSEQPRLQLDLSLLQVIVVNMPTPAAPLLLLQTIGLPPSCAASSPPRCPPSCSASGRPWCCPSTFTTAHRCGWGRGEGGWSRGCLVCSNQHMLIGGPSQTHLSTLQPTLCFLCCRLQASAQYFSLSDLDLACARWFFLVGRHCSTVQL